MGFDVNKFVNTKFQPRQAEITVESLKDFFDEGDKPSFVVRGLTGIELGLVNEAVEKTTIVNEVVEKLFSKNPKEKVEGAFEGLGLGESTPVDIVKRIEMFKLAVVEPKGVNQEFALKFCHRFPVEFFNITNKILELTGKGQESLVKQKSSGDKKE